MTVATRTAVELVRFAPESDRSHKFIEALAMAGLQMGLDVGLSNTYRGGAPVMVFWGPGAPVRAEAMRVQVAAGGHAIALDLPYWDRYTKVRLSIDAPHPQAWVMRKPLSTSRFQNDPQRPPVFDAWNPTGPIVIAGLGPKAREQYGAKHIDEWEADMMRACLARWARPVIYRRKLATLPVPGWATKVVDGPIDTALQGASLVITWHSNVAVDAIRLGIPVVCRDGAAAAVCASELPEAPAPLPTDVRDQFLANLAWFQWAPTEARECWTFLQELLS